MDVVGRLAKLAGQRSLEKLTNCPVLTWPTAPRFVGGFLGGLFVGRAISGWISGWIRVFPEKKRKTMGGGCVSFFGWEKALF